MQNRRFRRDIDQEWAFDQFWDLLQLLDGVGVAAELAVEALDGARVLKPETVELMSRNHIGDLGVPALKSAIPGQSADFTFIEGLKEKLDKEFDNVKRLKFEASEDVSNGGCVVETNFGDVNATLEQRLERLWGQLNDKLPKTSDVMSEVSGEIRSTHHMKPRINRKLAT